MNICKWLFGKKEKSWVRFYSLDPGVAKLYPIISSNQVKRPWLSIKQGPDPDNGPMWTKNCPGIKKLIQTGWVMTAPADFKIVTNGDGVNFFFEEPYRFTKVTLGREKYVGFHNQHQTELILDDPNKTLKQAVKLDTPWRLAASSDMMLIQMPINYNNESRFTAASGIIDPRFTHVLNVQLFWHMLEGETIVKAGTPLCQYIPVKRDYLNIDNHNVTIDTATAEDEETEKMFNFSLSSNLLSDDNLGARLKRVITALEKK